MPQSIAQPNDLLARFAQKMSDSKARVRLYSWCAMGLYWMAVLLMVLKVRYGMNDRKFDFAPSDAKNYYAYIVSIVAEGSFDPNAGNRHWGYTNTPGMLFDRRGRYLNPYPIGVSLSVSPSFLVAHVLSKMMYAVTGSHWFVPNGYTILYQYLNLALVMFASWGTFVLIDRLMVCHFGISGAATALGVIGAWIGTQYTYHLLRFPLMSHVFGPFWATAFVFCSVAAVKKIKRFREVGWHWTGMAVSLVMAFECRNTNLIWGVFGLYPVYLVVRDGLMLRLLCKQLPWMLLALIPLILQMLVWHDQFGRYLAVSYGKEATFYWTHPAFWQEMFSLRAGLLLWVPVWTMGLIGLIIYARSYPGSGWIVGCYLLSFLMIWYVLSAYWAWPLGNYPNRGFAEWIGMVAIGLGLLFHRGWHSQFRTKILLGLLLAFTCGTWLAGMAYDARKLRRYGDEVNVMGPDQARYAR